MRHTERRSGVGFFQPTFRTRNNSPGILIWPYFCCQSLSIFISYKYISMYKMRPSKLQESLM